MMTSLGQNFSPHPGMHPGMAPGHPMPGPHQQGQQGPPPQQMHMGVSGPGPQVSQAGVMMGGMPPGAGGPSAHALQHLNPGAQQQQFIQQQQMFAQNPNLHQMQQAHIMQQRQAQAARQAMLAQQYSGQVPMGMPNGMGQMTPAQFQAMRGGPMTRPVNLPQHLQAQQQQAEHQAHQQQAAQHQAQAQHNHQMMQMQQQMALSQAAANNQGQPPQMNQQALQQAAMQHQQQSQQAQQTPQPGHQQNPQNPQNPQPNPQAAQATAIAQQAAAQQAAQHQHHQQQAQSQVAAQQQAAQQAQIQAQAQQGPSMQRQGEQQAMLQQRQGDPNLKGQCLMKLKAFADALSNFGGSKQRDDLTYWMAFVERFFAQKGVLRHSLWVQEDSSNKQYEITFPALPRYFHAHFESGIKNMQMIMEGGTEKALPNNGHYIESQKSSFVYWFDNGSQLIASGSLKAHFDADQKIELLEFVTNNHEEYLPRSQVINAARPLHEWTKEWHKVNPPNDGKQSPEMNKKKAKAMKSPPNPPPEIDLPESKAKPHAGITPHVFRFLELAEVIVQMNPLFSYSQQHNSLTPYAALEQYVAQVATLPANNAGGQQQNPTGPRTPGMGNFPLGASPAAAHLQLPDGSPHIGGSPAQPPNMQLQHSQHGTSSSGPSANTSPNTSNKRRRPSTVKAEEEQNQVNGAQKTAVKPSPRIGGKRQKGNPA